MLQLSWSRFLCAGGKVVVVLDFVLLFFPRFLGMHFPQGGLESDRGGIGLPEGGRQQADLIGTQQPTGLPPDPLLA